MMSYDGLAKLSFTLPNGVRIAAYNPSDSDWEAIDVCAEFPNGASEIICSVDYEKNENKLRVFVHDRESDDPCYELLDYFGLSKAAVSVIKARILDLQYQLENSMYANEAEEARMEEEKADLLETLRLAGIAKEEIP